MAGSSPPVTQTLQSPPHGESKDEVTNNSHEASDTQTSSSNPSIWRRIFSIISYTPKRCRWDPSAPPQFSMALNFLFAFAACFTVASLYYSHPILNILALSFSVTYEQSSLIPTLAQAGYATGLLLLCPLGDLLPRRPFVLLLVLLSSTLWIGLCLTRSFRAFAALSFLQALTTVTPQLMLPLVGELAPPHRRATALSIVSSGLLLGILIARVLAGTVTQFAGWRVVYWVGLGVQGVILGLLWGFMPDYPATNRGGVTVVGYVRMLGSIGLLVWRNPLLVQAGLMGMLTSATFTSFWTTLTFLLAGEGYGWSPLQVGLFGLIGVAAMALGPPYSRVVVDRFAPLFSTVVGEGICLVGIVVGTYTGRRSIAGPVIQAVAIDFGLQTAQTANRASIYTIDSKARNRINTAYMVAVFCGQLMGTSVGNHLYAEGGWIKSGSASVGFIVAAIVVCVVRGPWEKGWVGWRGGWSIARRDLGPKKGDEEKGKETSRIGEGTAREPSISGSTVNGGLEDQAVAANPPEGEKTNDQKSVKDETKHEDEIMTKA